MTLRMKQVLGLLAGAAVPYGAWLAVRAHRDLVTLNVRNMDVRKVVAKIEWQTWESILVHKDVQGQVTLNVRKMPLEEVLRIVGDQTSSRWSAIYPLYSREQALAVLKRALRGEIDPAEHGWTNLQSRGFFRGGPMFGGGPFGPAESNQTQRISLRLEDKDVSFAARAFDRYLRARVVPEDGTSATVNLTLRQATPADAVAQLARKVRRSWTKLYTLRAEFGPGGPGGPRGPGGPGGFIQLAARDPKGPEGRGPGGPPQMTDQQREEFRKQREALEEEFKETLPAAERQRVEEAQQQREAQFKEMQNLTPEQRRERFAQMGGPAMDRRNLDRIRNSTPEQRAEQQRRMNQMRQRFEQQRQQQPQPPAR